ncbi:MAG: HAD family hydrolase [Acidobacteriota bacterium]|nr:HAD family hydrolase [Acidobacteriota bacterium]
MKSSHVHAIFFDAGNTLLYPRLDERARDLTEAGFPARVEDFHAAERAAKQKLDEWLWPQIRKGEVPRTIDHYFWGEYLASLMGLIGAPEAERTRLIRMAADGFRNIRTWSVVMPETPGYLASLKEQGYFLGVISNSVGTMEDQLRQVGLRDYFQAVFDSAIVGVEKPHPEIFQLALASAKVKANETVFVGDTNATDVGGAQLAGLHGVLIDRINAYPNAACPRITLLPELDSILAGI